MKSTRRRFRERRGSVGREREKEVQERIRRGLQRRGAQGCQDDAVVAVGPFGWMRARRASRRVERPTLTTACRRKEALEGRSAVRVGSPRRILSTAMVVEVNALPKVVERRLV